MVLANMIHDTKERIFEDPIFFLPLEDNIMVAKNQQPLYTYHKWRERQHGIENLIYQVQLCSLPSLQEIKVEEFFHELPFWRVTHFVWMIAWEWELHM